MFRMADIESETEKIHETNHSILCKLEEYQKEGPTRQEAFTHALSLENSSGELHFESYMNELHESRVENIFQKLNGEDKNHALRIMDYMILNGITNP